MTTQPAQRDGASLLLSLTRDPARIEARLRQAAQLEAAQVPDRAVHTLVKIASTGRLTLENILDLRDTGIDIDALRDIPVPARAPWSVYRCDDDTGCDCGKWIATNRTAAAEFDTESAAQAYVAVNLGTHSEDEYAWAEVEIPSTRPAGCCGACPPIEGGGYDCTCSGNPRCPNYTGVTPTHAPNRDAMGARSAEQATDGHRDGRDDSRPAERRWRIRYHPRTRLTLGEWHGVITPRWHATDPECGAGRTPTTCTCTTHRTWNDAIAHVTAQLRNHALTAIENQEATNQPQEDQ